MNGSSAPLWRRGLVWSAVALALAGVFATYFHPDLMLSLANQLWACF
jgi:hypothetical protein